MKYSTTFPWIYEYILGLTYFNEQCDQNIEQSSLKHVNYHTYINFDIMIVSGACTICISLLCLSAFLLFLTHCKYLQYIFLKYIFYFSIRSYNC